MTFKRFDSVVAWIEDIVSAFCLAGIVVIAAGSVFGRYVLHTGFLWADEVNQMLLVAMGMFGSARAVRSNGHAEFTSFINNRKSRTARIAMRAAINILTIVLLVFMFVIYLRRNHEEYGTSYSENVFLHVNSHGIRALHL